QIGQADPSLFKGDNRQLEFVSSYSIGNGVGQPVRVKYAAEGDDLVYSETSVAGYVPNRSSEEVTERFAGLCPGFRYLYLMPNKQLEWMNNSSNDPKASLPRAVRVEVSGEILVVPIMDKR